MKVKFRDDEIHIDDNVIDFLEHIKTYVDFNAKIYGGYLRDVVINKPYTDVDIIIQPGRMFLLTIRKLISDIAEFVDERHDYSNGVRAVLSFRYKNILFDIVVLKHDTELEEYTNQLPTSSQIYFSNKFDKVLANEAFDKFRNDQIIVMGEKCREEYLFKMFSKFPDYTFYDAEGYKLDCKVIKYGKEISSRKKRKFSGRREDIFDNCEI